jgi:hypothetical protein
MSEPLIYVIIMINMIFCHVQANHVNQKNHIKICGSDNVSNHTNHSSDSSKNHVNQKNHTKIMSEPLIYVIIMINMIFCHVQANHVNHKNHIKICGSDNVSNHTNHSSDSSNHVNQKNHIKICGSDNVSSQKKHSSDNYLKQYKPCKTKVTV